MPAKVDQRRELFWNPSGDNRSETDKNSVFLFLAHYDAAMHDN